MGEENNNQNNTENQEENLSFEKALEDLEKTVEKMEKNKLSLDEMIKYYEKGRKLSEFCNKKLKNFEKKIEVLVNEDKNGSPEWEDFESESENNNNNN